MIKKILVIIILCVSLFVFLEIICYLIIPDSKLNRLEAILRILKEDPTLFWRQRANLNTKFQEVNVVTNSLGLRNKEINVKKDNNIYRIICLGASPTFGWGVNFYKTYPFLLEQELKNNILSRKIEVINGGQIGYTTYQGAILLEKYLTKYSPDLITVSYVLNDIDRYRFYRNEGLSDKELSIYSPFKIKLSNMLNKSKLCLVLKRATFYLIDKSNKLDADILKKQFELSKVRVSNSDYKENLEKIIRICRNHNIKLIFIKMPINLSLPHLSKYEKNILKQDYKLSKFYYNFGCHYKNMKQYKMACVLFKKAKDYIILECYQDGKIYQRIMENVAQEYGIPLVDADRIFINESRKQELFNSPSDPIHPNSAGHKVIARAVYTEILKYNLFKD